MAKQALKKILMNNAITLAGIVSLCVACSIDTTKQSAGAISNGGSSSTRGGSGASNGGTGGIGTPDAGGTNAGGMNAGGMNAGGMNAGGMNAGGMNAGGMNAGGMNAGGSVDAPNQVDVCKSTAAIVCKKVYEPGCDSAEQLAGLAQFWGQTADSCTAYNVQQCRGVSCSLSDAYSPLNNQTCLDESNALTCEAIKQGDTFPKSCRRMCDPAL